MNSFSFCCCSGVRAPVSFFSMPFIPNITFSSISLLCKQLWHLTRFFEILCEYCYLQTFHQSFGDIWNLFSRARKNQEPKTQILEYTYTFHSCLGTASFSFGRKPAGTWAAIAANIAANIKFTTILSLHTEPAPAMRAAVKTVLSNCAIQSIICPFTGNSAFRLCVNDVVFGVPCRKDATEVFFCEVHTNKYIINAVLPSS